MNDRPVGNDRPAIATDAMAGDERRGLLRIDDRLLLEYWKVGEPPPAVPLSPSGLSEETVAAMIGKPTTELLAQMQGQEAQSILIPWLVKIDWVLELMLRTLTRLAPDGIAMPSLTDVNVSGGGIRFLTPRRFTVYDHLELELILPPFAPIRTQADILRVSPQDARGNYTVATKFTTIRHEDQERLIRHVLQKQAAQLRERHLSPLTGEQL